MRGAALAFPNLCVGPPHRQGIAPTLVAFVIGLLNCVSKGEAAQPPRGLLRPVCPPLIPDMLWCPGLSASCAREIETACRLQGRGGSFPFSLNDPASPGSFTVRAPTAPLVPPPRKEAYSPPYALSASLPRFAPAAFSPDGICQ
eukprot:Gb_17110 [translate_table: standard]